VVISWLGHIGRPSRRSRCHLHLGLLDWYNPILGPSATIPIARSRWSSPLGPLTCRLSFPRTMLSVFVEDCLIGIAQSLSFPQSSLWSGRVVCPFRGPIGRYCLVTNLLCSSRDPDYVVRPLRGLSDWCSPIARLFAAVLSHISHPFLNAFDLALIPSQQGICVTARLLLSLRLSPTEVVLDSSIPSVLRIRVCLGPSSTFFVLCFLGDSPVFLPRFLPGAFLSQLDLSCVAQYRSLSSRRLDCHRFLASFYGPCSRPPHCQGSLAFLVAACNVPALLFFLGRSVLP
jgi:hypothetical protein